MFNELKNLIIVYKDELLLNYLSALINEKDDNSDGTAVGTRDNSIDIAFFNEKQWKTQEKGIMKDKILYLGNIKGTENLIPLVSVNYKFNKWGIKYGWSGKQAVIIVDEYEITKEEYETFLKEFKSLHIIEVEDDTTKKKVVPFLPVKMSNKVKKTVKRVGTMVLFGAAGLGASLLADSFVNKAKLKQQLYLYGIYKLYTDHLETFMNS